MSWRAVRPFRARLERPEVTKTGEFSNVISGENCSATHSLGGGDRAWRPCVEKARRRADGVVRLSASPGERRRARRAGGAGDPARARADLNARSARSGAPELSARIGIECGSVVVDANGEVFGEAPNVAARVQAAAEPGSVLVTGSVQRQVAGLFVVEEKGAHGFKGVAQPLSLYRVVRASGGAEGAACGR